MGGGGRRLTYRLNYVPFPQFRGASEAVRRRHGRRRPEDVERLFNVSLRTVGDFCHGVEVRLLDMRAKGGKKR